MNKIRANTEIQAGTDKEANRRNERKKLQRQLIFVGSLAYIPDTDGSTINMIARALSYTYPVHFTVLLGASKDVRQLS